MQCVAARLSRRVADERVDMPRAMRDPRRTASATAGMAILVASGSCDAVDARRVACA